MWGWALYMFRELIKEVKECKKGCTTICVSAEVLDRVLDLYFPHSIHPTQKAVVQREDDLRRAKENERNRFNGPDYLRLRRSSVRIVDEAGPSRRTELVPDTMDPLPTQELAVLPTPGTQTSQPDKRPRLHPRDRAKEIATSELKKQKITTETPTRTPQRNLNFEEVTTDTSVPPASASTTRGTQMRLQARNQRGSETKQPPVRVPSTLTQVVQELSTDDEDTNHATTPRSPTPERPRIPTPAPTNMALVTYVPNPTYQLEPEMDRLKRITTEEEGPADPLRQHVAQVHRHLHRHHKKKLCIQAVVRIVTLQAQMRMLRHEAATTQQQLDFYRAQHPSTLIPDDLSPTEEEEEDIEPENENRMETIPYQEDELDSDDEETTNPPD